MKKNSIAYVAGHSGGHIIPALTHAHQNYDKTKLTSILFFCSNKKLDQTILTQSTLALDIYPLQVTCHKKFFFLKKLCMLFFIMCAIFRSIYLLHKHKPTRVISFGGLIAVPVCIAAKIVAIPIEIYELNAIPGKANKFVSFIAQKIHVCFAPAKIFFPSQKTFLSPYPIRYTKKEIIGREKAHALLNYDPKKVTIFILGGSQGSLFLNNLIKTWLEQDHLIPKDIQLIHQTGNHDQTDWKKWYVHHHIPAICFSYQHDVSIYYNAADLIICRAGAGTLFESLFFEKKIYTIPLETATTSHQKDNAYALHKEYPHLITVIEQKNVIRYPQKFSSSLSQAVALAPTEKK